MTYKEAKTAATYKADLLQVNHVIVKVAHKHNVYTEKQYPNGYLELVKPTEKPIEVKKKAEEIENPIELRTTKVKKQE